ncbi:MAG: DNA repair protein RecO [bacterium]|nr:DNA repair protein RecO [bacterium]
MSAMLHAFFLHTRPYRETSLLVDVFTAESGRMSAVMRGGRRVKGGGAQLFQPLVIEIAGVTELKTIRRAEMAGMALMLKGTALFSAFYLNEILIRLLPREEPQQALFVAYADALGQLAENADPAALLRTFECGLLDSLGYGIDFMHDSDSGETVSASCGYDFHPERGFTRSRGLHAVSGAVLQLLAAGNFAEPAAALAAKRINRLALARLLGNKPLKSRELFLALRE